MHQRPHRPSRATFAALLALCASLAVALPLTAAAADPIEFTTSSGPTPIQLGMNLPAPKLGVKAKTVKFSVNGADAKALDAAQRQEGLLDDADVATTASAVAAERMAAIRELLSAAQEDQANLRALIEQRLIERYKDGNAGDLTFLLSGDGVSDLIDRSRVLDGQSKRDIRMLDDYEETVARLDELEQALDYVRDLQGDRASDLTDRADRLNEHIVAARVAHMEAPDDLAAKGTKQGIAGTWYVMDGAFETSLFLPTGLGGYQGGIRTPARPATAAEIQAVLTDPRIELDASGRLDIATGQIDGRLLDALHLAAIQFQHIKITSLKSDHGVYTAGGNVSEHSYGCAADIGTIGSTYITPGAQTAGSEVELGVRFFMGLGAIQPDLAPHQVISLFDLGGSSLAMGDHGDHIHLGYSC